MKKRQIKKILKNHERFWAGLMIVKLNASYCDMPYKEKKKAVRYFRKNSSPTRAKKFDGYHNPTLYRALMDKRYYFPNLKWEPCF